MHSLLHFFLVYSIYSKSFNENTDGDTFKLTYTLALNASICYSYNELKCSTNSSVNQILEDIPLNYTHLIINLYADYLFINFTHLSHKMSVQINSTKNSFDFYINGGDIRDFVSDLTIIGLKQFGLTIKNEILSVEKIILINSKIRDDNIYNAEFIYLEADSFSLNSLIQKFNYCINTEQISLILDSYSPTINYRISFDNFGWYVYNSTSMTFINYIPYTYSLKLGLIGISNRFELQPFTNSTTTKPINITLTDPILLPNSYSNKILDNDKFLVQIITTGDWSYIKKTTDVYFTSYENSVILDTEQCDLRYINLIQNSIEYPSDIIIPAYPTAIPTRSISSSQSPSQSPEPTKTPLPSQTPSTNMHFEDDTAYYYIDNLNQKNDIDAFSSIPLNIRNLIVYARDKFSVHVFLNSFTHKISVKIIVTNQGRLFIHGGDIREYVSELTIINAWKDGVASINEPLIVDKLNLIKTKIYNDNQYNFNFIYLTADSFSLNSLIDKFSSSINAKQITFDVSSNSQNIKYCIEFNNTGWTVYNSSSYLPYLYIPYKYTPILGLIGITDKIELSSMSEFVTKTQPVNITLLNYSENAHSSLQILENNKYVVKIVTIGNWKRIYEATDVYFTSYNDYTALDVTECDMTHINIIEREIENPYDVGPYPTPNAHLTKITYSNDTAYFDITYTCEENLYEKCFIDNELASIPLNYNNLFVYLKADNIRIDFTKLSHKMSVRVISTNEEYNFNIVGGDIREYISELTIKNLYYGFYIIKNNLLVDKFNLINSVIKYSFNYVICSNLTADFRALNSILEVIGERISIDQISLIIDSNPILNYYIKYGDYGWYVHNNAQPTNELYISYRITWKFGIIGISNKIELDCKATNLGNEQSFNITLIDPDWLFNSHYFNPHLSYSKKILDDDKFLVQIITTGNWSYIKKTTDVYFNSYENSVILDTEQCDLRYINLIQNSIEYPSDIIIPVYPTAIPTSSCMPTQTPIPPYELFYKGNSGSLYINERCTTNPSEKCFIDEALESIPQEIESLEIFLKDHLIQIDFHKLSHKIPVKIISKMYEDNFYIIGGDISEFVSELTISNLYYQHTITVQNSDLIVEKLNLVNSIINPESYNFGFTYLTADSVSLNSIKSKIKSDTKSDQISLILDLYSDILEYQITFNNTGWTIYERSHLSSYIYLPYQYSSKLGLIGISSKYEFKAETSSTYITQPVNITLLNSDLLLSSYKTSAKLLGDKFLVHIITSGNWDNINEITDVYFTSYEDYVEINMEKCDSAHINIIRRSIDNYSISLKQPYPTAIPTISKSKSPTASKHPLQTNTPPIPTPSSLIRFDENIAYFDLYRISSNEIDSALASIPFYIDKLLITLKSNNKQINLSKLSHQMHVQIATIDTDSDYNLFIVGGDIRSYVSELTIINFPNNGISISEITNLTIETINLINSKIISGKFYVSNLAVDIFSRVNIGTFVRSMKVKQVSFILNPYTPQINGRIVFSNKDWTFYIDGTQIYSMEYGFADSLGIIGIFNKLEFGVAGRYTSKSIPINITFIDPNILFAPYSSSLPNLLENNKFTVNFVTDIDWGKMNATDVYFYSFEKYIYLNTDGCYPGYINIIQKSLDYPFDWPENPYPIPTQSPYPEYYHLLNYSNDTAYFTLPYECSNVNDENCYINLGLASIPSNINNLIIYQTHDYEIEVDFRKLSHKMDVQVISLNIDGIFKIIGADIKNYVSELTIKGFSKYGIRITKNQLLVRKLILINTIMPAYTPTQRIQFGLGIADSFSLKALLYLLEYNYKTAEISVILDSYSPTKYYKIVYSSDEWILYNSSSSTDRLEIPYSSASQFGVIGLSNKFELCPDKYATYIYSINITLIDPNLLFNLSSSSAAVLLEEYKFPVEIFTSGDWSNIEFKRNVYFTSYENYIELNTSQLDTTYINFVQNPINYPSNPPEQPYPTPFPPQKPYKSPSVSAIPTYSPLASNSPTASASKSASKSATESASPSYSPSPSSTRSPKQTLYPTKSPGPSYTPTKTPNPTWSPFPTPMPSETISQSPSKSVLETESVTPSPKISLYTCNISNCFVCESTYICIKCNENYDLVNNECLLHSSRTDLCFDYIPGCEKCVAGEYNQCINCDSINHWISNGNGCICKSEYDQVGDICVYRENRTSCEQYGIYNCDICLDDGNHHFCQLCHTGYEGDNCNKCSEGYFASQSGLSFKCTPCNENCLKCSNETHCITCKKGYSEEYNCNQCINGYYYINGSCVTCGYGCEVCLNATHCNLCKNGYNIAQNCEVCEENYFSTFNSTTNELICTFCGYGCESCSNSSQCDKCKTGFSIESNCNQCIDGYIMKRYVSGTFECVSCGIGCETCKTIKTCEKFKDHFINKDICENGYFVHDFHNGTVICDKCPMNCEKCINDNQCTSCKIGYRNERNLCQECENGYYSDLSYEFLRCLSCPTNCANCNNAEQCIECKIGYTNSETNSICNVCDSSNGYIDVSTSGSVSVCRHECENDNDCDENHVCQSNTCICRIGYTGDNCKDCAIGYRMNDSKKCDECEIRYFKQDDGTCLSCGNNCLNCSSNSVCFHCEFGYILNANHSCIYQDAVISVYEDPELEYLDQEVVNNQCFNGKEFIFDKKIVDGLTSDINSTNNVLRVEIESSISSIKLNCETTGVFLDLTSIDTDNHPIDLYVSENQHISSLKFDDNSNVILNVKNNNSKNMNIIGGKQVTLNLANNDYSTIQIGNISPIKNLNEPFIIESNVEVIIDSINLYGGISIKSSENTKVSVNNVSVKQAAIASINNICVNNILEIGSSSQIQFDNNATFSENSKIVINYSSTSNIKYAPIIGKLPAQPPQVFVMKSAKNANSLNSPKFLLAQSTEDWEFQCSQWQKKCSSSIGQSDDFNDCRCMADNDLQSDDSLRLYAVIDNHSNKKLSRGAIVGIVIACVAVVAAIVIFLVYFFVFKKKQKLSENENDDDNYRNGADNNL